MAKKYCRQSSLKLLSNKIVYYLYSHGFLHSFVWHLFIFLCLALLYPSIDLKPEKLSPIVLSFCTSSEINEPDLNSFPQIEDIVDIKKEEILDDPMKKPAIPIADPADAAEEAPNIDALFSDIPTAPSVSEDYEVAKLTEEIKQLLPDAPNTERQSAFVKKKSISSSNKKSSALGLPSSLLESREQDAVHGLVSNNLSGGMHQGEIGKRLQEHGAQTGDVQVSLAWNTTDDLDLHVIVNPINSHISWRQRQGACGGVLDIDMNFHPQFLNNKPIENIFWARGVAPSAEYRVGVHYFASWSGSRVVQATVLIKIDDQTKTFPVSVTFGQPLTHITTFRR